MARRSLLLVAVLAVLAPGPADGQAPRPVDAAVVEPGTATVQARPTKRKAKRATRKRVKPGARRGSRPVLTARRRRPPQVAPARNMPVGWRWPPSAAMLAAGTACTSRLDELGVVWRPAATTKNVATPITVPSMTFGEVKLVPTFRPPPFVMDCHLALAMATFAKDLHGLGVREIRFSRIHGYTLVQTQGRTKNVLSRHALGLAIDIRAVVDADGREAVVLGDYLKDDPLLLRLEVFLNDSGGFRTVLTPRNDPASHDDHFHVEVAVEYGP